jgi:ABC-type nitrate/sulfonate/bicarbonate transport system ATPase subunit
MTAMFRIEIDSLTKSFAEQSGGVTPLRDLTLQFPAGAVSAVIGRSGCGKTTLLRQIAGIDAPDRGSIRFVDESGRGARPKLSVVFQEPRLFAWMNVRRNVEIAVRHAPEPERSKAVDAALELVGLAGRDRAYPDELSGGMAQRVGLARALVGEPDILLMDEAFGALDAITRQKLYREFVAILEKRPMTVVLVTHDVTEAVMLSERVLRLAEGGVRNRWDIDLPYPRNLAMPQVGVLSEKILSEFFA